MKNTLLLGYGNADRQDDGVAWHVLTALAERLGCATEFSLDDGFPFFSGQPSFLFVLQLTPELAEIITEYDRLCFVDAHTGRVPQDLHMESIALQYHTSPFTHHMTPAACLSISQALYGHSPEAILVSLRGYEFGFSRSLSPATASLVPGAVNHIWQWLFNSQ